MKKPILYLTLLVVSIQLNAQTARDVFKSGTPVAWLGLDFTEARFIGDRERLGSHSDVLHLMEAINQLIINEPTKYDIAEAIERTRIEKAINITSNRNSVLEVGELLSDKSKDYQRLKPSDIEAIIGEYDFEDLTGIGLMFNVESFSKMDESASVWVTFINMDTKEVLFTQRLTGKPGGFGLRNYWGRSIYSIIESVKKKEYEMWRRRNS